MEKTAQVVIEIPKELVTDIKDDCGMSMEALPIIVNAICNGIILPKHGRLIDEREIKKCGWNFVDHHAKTDAPTILKAWGNEE